VRPKFCAMVPVLAVLWLAGAAFAHHGTAAYDTSKMTTVTGTVTAFDFINPHCQVYWDVKSENGETEKWQGELTAPNKLARAGWNKDTLKPGDKITITGYRTKTGTNVLWIRKLIGPDGNALPLSEIEN
jgi:hypothetical protein